MKVLKLGKSASMAQRSKPTLKSNAGPKKRDQVNLTDEESRIMPQSGGGFQQAYNSQASIDIESMIVVATHMTQNTNDKQEIAPALEQLLALPSDLGRVDSVIADAGYFAEANVKKCLDANITPYICTGREKHNQGVFDRFKEPDPPPEGASRSGPDEVFIEDKGWASRVCRTEMYSRASIRNNKISIGFSTVQLAWF